MHLLVDIRTSNPADTLTQDYAVAWVELWKVYHPDDTITYLTYPWVSLDGNIISVPRWWDIFGKKKLAHHKNGPDRIISFSKLKPIDADIPTLTHIFDNADILYPRNELNYFERKKKEVAYKTLLRKSGHIIVPHLEIGMELVEMFWIPEKKISVIPYFIPKKEYSSFTLLHPYGITPMYWIAEGSAGDEWNPFQLLQAYSHYIHEYNGTKRLIIVGDLGENLKHISDCIRGLDIMEYVKIIGTLPKWEKNALYENASGWISLWRYYGSGPNIAYALAYGLPIFTSDIAPIRDYADITVHPNHTDEFLSKLLIFSKLQTSTEKYTHSQHTIMDVYARVLAESTCN